jgi:hypothetical protein
MDFVLRQTSGFSVKVSGQQFTDLDFADDVVLLEEAKQRLQLLLDTIADKAEKVGLIVNVGKSKSMDTFNSPLILMCNGKTSEQVQEFKYLGSWIEYDGGIVNEIKRRIGQATSAFNKLKSVWRSKKYSLRLKHDMSVLLHANGSWKLNVRLEKCILAFESVYLKRILNVLWQDRVTNVVVCRRTGQPPVTDLLKQRR